MNNTAALLVCSLTLSTMVSAQDADAVRASYGVSQHDGGVRAGGPGYSASFDEHGIEYLPLLGAAAEPVRFTLASVRRGAVDVWTRGEGTAPTVAGNRVCYRHGSQLTEVYDARVDGIEQSFVFAGRPAGSGDLVVCGKITTGLPLAAVSDDGVRYENAGGVGVTFGAVTGIDANGASVRGSIRANADQVEWVLPAAFVDGAAYPLVLDPLIGTAISIGNIAGSDDELPSVAYDAGSDRYLVVWNVALSATDAEIRGQILNGSGVLQGSSFVIEAGGDATVRPVVANVHATGRWIVAYRRHLSVASPPSTDTSVCARSVLAATGSMSAAVIIEIPGLMVGGATQLAIGGSQSSGVGATQDALVVLRKAPALPFPVQYVVSYILHVPASGSPSLGLGQEIASTTTSLGEIAISSHAGAAGRWLVAYTEGPGTGGATIVRGQIVAATGALCGSPILIASGSTLVHNPAVATSTGAHFAVAWEDAASAGILLRTMTWSGTCGSGSMALGAVHDPLSAGLDSQPALEFAKDKYVIAWRRSFLFGGVPRVYAKGLDPDGCVACGSEWSVDNTLLGLHQPAIAAKWSGGAANDEALVVWSNSAVRGRRFEARGNGTVADLGGACGAPAGNNVASYLGAPVIGSSDFQLVLQNPSAPVLALLIGLSNISLPCGPCTLVPALDIVASGANPNPLLLPCDVSYLGVQFYTQWLLFAPGGCPILPDFALSNALKFTIGE